MAALRKVRLRAALPDYFAALRISAPAAILGGIIGAALGVGLARLINDWSLAAADFGDPLGLIITCATFLSLFCGLIGWGIGVGMRRTSVEAPAVDPGVGPFIIAVEAGEASERVWAIIHRKGGHELPPGALMSRPLGV